MLRFDVECLKAHLMYFYLWMTAIEMSLSCVSPHVFLCFHWIQDTRESLAAADEYFSVVFKFCGVSHNIRPSQRVKTNV